MLYLVDFGLISYYAPSEEQFWFDVLQLSEQSANVSFIGPILHHMTMDTCFSNLGTPQLCKHQLMPADLRWQWHDDSPRFPTTSMTTTLLWGQDDPVPDCLSHMLIKAK